MNDISNSYQGVGASKVNNAQAKTAQKTQDVHQQSQASQTQRPSVHGRISGKNSVVTNRQFKQVIQIQIGKPK